MKVEYKYSSYSIYVMYINNEAGDSISLWRGVGKRKKPVCVLWWEIVEEVWWAHIHTEKTEAVFQLWCVSLGKITYIFWYLEEQAETSTVCIRFLKKIYIILKEASK